MRRCRRPSRLPRDIEERRKILRMLEVNVRQYDSFDDAALETQSWAFSQPDDPYGYRFDRLSSHIESRQEHRQRGGQCLLDRSRPEEDR